MEIMKRPTIIEIEKIKERLGDNVTFALVQSAGQALENYFNKDYYEMEFDSLINNDYPKWYKLTRFMLIQYSPVQVIEMIFKIIEDMADDYYPNFYPDIKKKKQLYKTNSKIPIIQIAENFGLKIEKNSCICPFHADGKPSLKFYPETNSFYCFGCNSGGDVLTFIQIMEELKSVKTNK